MRRSSWHQLHAGLRDGVALLSGDLDAVEHDRAGARRDDAHQALQGGALAGAVAAEQRHDFVLSTCSETSNRMWESP